MKKRILLSVLLFYQFSYSQTDTAHTNTDSLENFFSMPVFNTAGENAETQFEQQDVSSLLQSSKDVFTQFAGFQFGLARYSIRGLNTRNQNITINGVQVNSPETGSASWSSWGGLNDVTRYPEVGIGPALNRTSFSGAGGFINFDSRASSFKKSSRLSYAGGNRVYRHRMMATRSTGMLPKGWAVSVSASSRFGDQVFIPGTYFRASSFFISADKKISDKHMLSFTGFFAPLEQGRSSAATKQAYELTGTNYYNADWGRQSGKVRNANVATSARPTFIFGDVISLKNNAKIYLSGFLTFGKTGSTGLNWYDADNPRPDYYRYMPAYWLSEGDTSDAEELRANWRGNETTRQINWDRMVQMNEANLYTDPHLLGQSLNSTETRARYIVENKIENLLHTGLNAIINKRIRKLFLSAGFQASQYHNRKYKEVEDLLGSSYWIDVDQFAEGLGVEESIMQNDLDNPNKKVRKGDRFGYDYSVNIQKTETWGQLEQTFSNLDLYAGISLSYSKVWRQGYVANGKFPGNSKGKSDVNGFINPAIKAGYSWKISGRNYFTANGLIQSRAPQISNLFISPKVRNDIVSAAGNEQVLSADVNFIAKYPAFKMRLTYYTTQINNQTWLRTYWHDSYNTNVNLVMKNVNQNFQGIEFGAEKTIRTIHLVQVAFGYGTNVYTNRPTLEAWQDNNNQPIFTGRTSYLKNYRVGGTPQLVSGLGYKYSGKKHWFAGLYANYVDEIYVEPNPDRRTKEATAKYIEGEEEMSNGITKQERLPGYFYLNANAGKSFRIKRKYFLNFNLSINNLLNNTNAITSGFESLRWDQTDIHRFENKYYYMNGISYMLMMNCSF
jgi:hypothetical protein